MSRTTKDKSFKLRHPEWATYSYWEGKSAYLNTKKRKELDTEFHWMSTPGWWNKLMHTRPERRKIKVMLTVLTGLECLDDVDVPDLGRKPHIYYW